MSCDKYWFSSSQEDPIDFDKKLKVLSNFILRQICMIQYTILTITMQGNFSVNELALQTKRDALISPLSVICQSKLKDMSLV